MSNVNKDPGGPQVCIDDLLELLEEWWSHTQALIDIPESQSIEFKRQPYDLADARGKLEFAKDVSALSNAGGGIIVLGIATKRGAAIGRDLSSSVTPLRAGALDLDQLQAVARSWLYPPQRNLEVDEYHDPTGGMLVAIRVPAAGRALTIVHAGDVQGTVHRTFFSVAIRHDDRVDYLTPAEIHDLMARGRQASALNSQPLDGPPADGSRRPGEAAAHELASALEVHTEDGAAVLILQGLPAQAIRLERMHDDDGVAGVFKNPPLRRGGFNLDWGVAPEPYGPGGIAATLGRREGISVTHGGIATLRVTTGPTGLGWGMERYAGGQPSINPTALAELTFEFCRFYAAALRAGGVDSVDRSYRLIIPRHPNPLRLTSGHRPLGGDYLRAYDLAAPLEEEVGPVATATPCELVAGKLLGRLYEYFGMGRTLNPYLDPETGDLVPNRILALDGSGL